MITQNCLQPPLTMSTNGETLPLDHVDHVDGGSGSDSALALAQNDSQQAPQPLLPQQIAAMVKEREKAYKENEEEMKLLKSLVLKLMLKEVLEERESTNLEYAQTRLTLLTNTNSALASGNVQLVQEFNKLGGLTGNNQDNTH